MGPASPCAAISRKSSHIVSVLTTVVSGPDTWPTRWSAGTHARTFAKLPVRRFGKPGHHAARSNRRHRGSWRPVHASNHSAATTRPTVCAARRHWDATHARPTRSVARLRSTQSATKPCSTSLCACENFRGHPDRQAQCRRKSQTDKHLIPGRVRYKYKPNLRLRHLTTVGSTSRNSALDVGLID